MTSGEEIGQVFVRISARGDAVLALQELQEEFRRTLAMANNISLMSDLEGDITPIQTQLEELRKEVGRVTRTVDYMNSTMSSMPKNMTATIKQAIESAQDLEETNLQTADSALKVAMITSQTAAKVGDYTKAMHHADEAIILAGKNQVGLALALQNYVKVVNEAETGTSALNRSLIANANSQMRSSAETKRSSDDVIASFRKVTANINSVRAQINALGGDFNALTADTGPLNRAMLDLSQTFQKNIVHALTLTARTEGVHKGFAAARTAFKSANDELKQFGMSATLVEAKMNDLERASKALTAKNKAILERERFTVARGVISEANFVIAQLQNEVNDAMRMYQEETERLAQQAATPQERIRIQDERRAGEAQARSIALTQRLRLELQALADTHANLSSRSKARLLIEREAVKVAQKASDAISQQALDSAKAAMAARNHTEAVQILTQRLNQMTQTMRRSSIGNQEFMESLDASSLRGSAMMMRRLEAERQKAEALSRTPRARWWDSAIGQLRNLSGTVLALSGAFYTLQGAAMSALQAMQAGAQYSVIQAQLKLLADSTEEYNQALEISRKNIALFGGSIVNNLQNMNRLILLSNQSGASIEDLNDMLLLLSTKDPVQGIEGASIALNEALSEGTTRSLRQRFELGGEQLKMFTDQTLTANEQLALFEKELQKIGLSMELLEGSVSIGARSVNEFSAAWEEAMLASGQALNNSLVVPMEAMTVLLQNAISLLKTYNELVESGAKAREGQSKSLSLLISLASMMIPGSTLIDTLFRFAGAEVFQNVIASFTQMSPAAKDAAGGIKDLNDEMAAGEAQAKRQADAINEYIEKLILQTITEENNAEAKARLLDIAYQYGEGIIDMAAAQKLLSDEFSFTTNNTEQLAVALNVFHQEALKARQELLSAADASKAAANAMLEYIQQVVSSANEEAARAKALEELNRIALDLHNGTITLAEAGTQLQSSFGMTADMATMLAGQLRVLGSQAAITQQELVNAAAAAEAAFRQSMSAILQTRALIGKTGVEAAKIRVDQARDVLRQFQGRPTESLTQEEQLARAEAMNRLMEAQNELSREQVSLASDWAIETQRVQQRIDQLLPEYEQLVKYGDRATDSQKLRRLELSREIEMLRNKLPKAEKGGGAGGGSAARDDQSKLNDQLAMDQLKADQAAEDALIAHEERMLEIRKDYAERTLRAIEDYQEDQKSGRASFYESLTGIEDHGLQKAMSAQFEAAAMEAGKIAQTLGPDVAAQFLQQMQTNILNQAKRQQEIAKALDKNGEDFNPALAEYLQGVDQLFRVSEQGAINKILRARDSLASQEAGAVEEAQQKYIDALLKISDNAAESAERRIEAVRLAGKEIDLEIAKVEELGIMYEKIGFVPGSQRTVELQAFPGVQLDGNPENLTGIAAEIAAALQAIRNNTGETVGAIRRLAPSVTQ